MTARVGRWSVLSGLFVFAVNLVVQGLFASTEWVDTYGLTLQGPIEDFGPTVMTMVLIYPALFTFITLIVLFLHPRTRWIAWSCLVAPSSFVVYTMLAASTLLIYLTDLVIIGYVLGWFALLIAAITEFEIQDRGPQPWMGILFLALGYVIGLLFGVEVVAAHEKVGGFHLPDSVLSWLAAVLSLGIVLRFIRARWMVTIQRSS